MLRILALASSGSSKIWNLTHAWTSRIGGRNSAIFVKEAHSAAVCSLVQPALMELKGVRAGRLSFRASTEANTTPLANEQNIQPWAIGSSAVPSTTCKYLEEAARTCAAQATMGFTRKGDLFAFWSRSAAPNPWKFPGQAAWKGSAAYIGWSQHVEPTKAMYLASSALQHQSVKFDH